MPRTRKEAEEIVHRRFDHINFESSTGMQLYNFLVGKYENSSEEYCSNCDQVGRLFTLEENDRVKSSDCMCRTIKKRNTQLQKNFQSSNIPELYMKSNLSQWHNTGRDQKEVDDNNKNFKVVQTYSGKLSKMRLNGYGLFICGPNGVGKTYIACSIGNAAMCLGYSVKYYTMATIVQTEIGSWKDDVAKNVIKGIRSCDFMIIDDVDKVYRTKTGIELSIFDNLLRERLQMKRPCIFTSNRPMGSSENDYSKSIESMLREHCAEIIFVGDDWRKRMSSDIVGNILDDDS